MSRKLIIHNPDLKKLDDEAFDLEVRNNHLLVHGIPYVNSSREIKFGILVSKLDLAGERTVQPESHVMHFVGEHPCHKDGLLMTAIKNASNRTDLGEGLVIDHTFSSKPSKDGKYKDYYEKITQYSRMLSHEAMAIDANVKIQRAGTRQSADPEDVHHYPDTNSTRAEIGAISAKLKGLKIAIVGVGGTGSYVLDFVAKTHVAEIHLFDGDYFLNHNAFRAPGAPSIEHLQARPSKAIYLHGIYSKMHNFVVPHEYHIGAENTAEMSTFSFAFVCVDKPSAKKIIIDSLIQQKVQFVDVGIGIQSKNGSLTGSVRVTTCTPEKADHIERRISSADGEENAYQQNIQIAELNALNAALAVIKWKKLCGFYHDLEKEHHSSYSINVNKIINDESVA